MIKFNPENRCPHPQNGERESIAIAPPKLIILEKLLANLPAVDHADFMIEFGLAINPSTQELVPAESNNGVLTIGEKFLLDERLRRAASEVLPKEDAPDTDLDGKEVKDKLQDVFMEICCLAKKKPVMVPEQSLEQRERALDPEPLLMLDEELHHPNATLQLLTRIPGVSVNINHDRIDLVIIYQGSTYWATHSTDGVNGLKIDGTFTMLRDEGKKVMYTPRRDEKWRPLKQAELYKFLVFALQLMEADSTTYNDAFTSPVRKEEFIQRPKTARELVISSKMGNGSGPVAGEENN